MEKVRSLFKLVRTIKYQGRDHRFFGSDMRYIIAMIRADRPGPIPFAEAHREGTYIQAERLIMRPVNQQGTRDDLCIT